MSPDEIAELDSLKKRLLRQDGQPKKNASQQEISRLGDLQRKYDSEHSMDVAEDAKVEAPMKEYVITRGGRSRIKRVPDNRKAV